MSLFARSHCYHPYNLTIDGGILGGRNDEENEHVEAIDHAPLIENNEELGSARFTAVMSPYDSPILRTVPPKCSGQSSVLFMREPTIKLHHTSPTMPTMVCAVRFIDFTEAAPPWARFHNRHGSLYVPLIAP